jgi:hypothetical protein
MNGYGMDLTLMAISLNGLLKRAKRKQWLLLSVSGGRMTNGWHDEFEAIQKDLTRRMVRIEILIYVAIATGIINIASASGLIG